MKVAFIIAACILLMIFVYWGIPFIAKRLLKRLFLNRTHRSGDVYLTFDDGPDPVATPQILHILQKYKARASFFVVARQAEKYPDLIKAIINSGHTIGEHGYKHVHPWKTGPLGSIRDVINAARIFNSGLFPASPGIYRPPYGKYNIISLLYYCLKKKTPVFWDVDARDYQASAPEAVAEYVIQRIKPGCVILLHDGRQNAYLSNVSVTIKALEQILKTVSKRNVQFKPVDCLFQ